MHVNNEKAASLHEWGCIGKESIRVSEETRTMHMNANTRHSSAFHRHDRSYHVRGDLYRKEKNEERNGSICRRLENQQSFVCVFVIAVADCGGERLSMQAKTYLTGNHRNVRQSSLSFFTIPKTRSHSSFRTTTQSHFELSLSLSS